MTESEKEQIIEQFTNNKKGFYAWLFRNKSRAHLVEELRLMYPEAKSGLECVYRMVFDIKETPVCPVCGKKISFKAARSNSQTGFPKHCCLKCSRIDPHHQEMIRKTKQIKYGDPNWNNSKKTTDTCKKRYGGNGTRGDREKAKKTMLERYGVEYYTSSSVINKMRNNKEIQEKIQNTKREHNTFNKSEPEEELFKYLCNIYGEKNVIRQYKDLERYPFNCDFYIQSEDLFIELNLFPTHGTEPFDATNKNHMMLLEHCKQNPSNWIEEKLPLVWAGTDVKKYNIAIKNNLNYLRIYNLKDFYNEKSNSK